MSAPRSFRLASRLRTPRPRSWRMRLLAALLTVALAPLTVLLVAQQATMEGALRAAAVTSLHAAARQTSLRVDGFLDKRLGLARFEARSPLVAALLERRGQNRTEEDPSWNLSRDQVRGALEELASGDPVFMHGAALLDEEGAVLVATPREQEGREEAARRHVQMVRATGLPVVSLEASRVGEAMAGELVFASPVHGPSGRLLGVLRLSHRLEVLQHLAAHDVGLAGPRSFPLLVDETQRILAYGRLGAREARALLLQPAWRLEVESSEGSTLVRGLEEARPLGGPGEGDDVGVSGDGDFRDGGPAVGLPRAVRLLPHGGGEEAMAVERLRLAPWSVAFFQPEEVFLAPARRHGRLLLGLGLGMAGLAALAGVLLSRVLTTPVRRLIEAARRVAGGDLAVAAPTDGADEIAELARAFNAMTERLAHRLDMENMVAEIAKGCLGGSMAEADAAIESALERLGRHLDVDRVFTLLVHGESAQYRLGHDWRGEGVRTHLPRQRMAPAARFAWLFSQLRDWGQVHAPDLADLPPTAQGEREEFALDGVKSFAATAISQHGGGQGALVVTTVWGRRVLAEEERRLLAMVAEIIGNTLERREAQEALRRSEERYALAQKAANIGSWEWDIASGRLFWSDAIAPMFGFGRVEFSGTYKAFLERVHPDDRKLVLDAVGASFRHGVGYNVEHRILRTDGAERWVAEAGEVVRDEQGRPERMRGILQDITERKWAEDALARLNRRLEQLVEARTRDLEQKAMELEQANARLLELDRMKTTFLTSVSHELRTPLTSILGFAKLIAKDFARNFQELPGLEDRLRDRARRILENLEIIGLEGERLTRLINDLLDLAKIESGKVEWRDQTIAIERVIMRAVRAVSGQFSQKPGVRLEVSLEPGLPDVHLDSDRMAQVLINLLHNAVKFTDKGQVRLVVRQAREKCIQIRVEDTGKGIYPDDLQRIFDKFHQADQPDTRVAKPEGTGLGLAICKQIIEHYRGAIWAESQPGRGSAFVIELPAA